MNYIHNMPPDDDIEMARWSQAAIAFVICAIAGGLMSPFLS